MFGAEKSQILYGMISKSKLHGFTLINIAGAYDFNGENYSVFEANMQPIRRLPNLVSDLRWSDDKC